MADKRVTINTNWRNDEVYIADMEESSIKLIPLKSRMELVEYSGNDVEINKYIIHLRTELLDDTRYNGK